MTIKSDHWIRRMGEQGMISPFEPGQIRQDAAGNKGVCTLVNKAKGSLAAGEMSIAFYNQSAATAYASRITNKWVYDYTSPIKKKYRYWVAAATTDNDYATDSATGTVGFVRVDAA